MFKSKKKKLWKDYEKRIKTDDVDSFFFSRVCSKCCSMTQKLSSNFYCSNQMNIRSFRSAEHVCRGSKRMHSMREEWFKEVMFPLKVQKVVKNIIACIALGNDILRLHESACRTHSYENQKQQRKAFCIMMKIDHVEYWTVWNRWVSYISSQHIALQINVDHSYKQISFVWFLGSFAAYIENYIQSAYQKNTEANHLQCNSPVTKFNNHRDRL